MKYNIKVKPFLFSCYVLLLLLQIVLQEFIPIFQYLDEFTAAMALAYIIYKCTKEKIEKNVYFDIFILVAIFFIGMINTCIFEVQTNKKAIITDIGNLFKAFISFYAFYIGSKDKLFEFKYYSIKYLTLFCKVIIVPGFFLVFVNLFHDIGMHTDYLFGIRSFHYIFFRVGNLYSFCVNSLVIMSLTLLENDKVKSEKKYIFMTIILMISTLRVRAFLFAMLYLVGYVFFIKGKRIKIKFRYIIVPTVVGLYVALPKIKYYFIDNLNRARSVLLRYGITTMKNYFPLGAGYGTYGTFAAKEYHSELYTQYRFQRYYGLSSDNGAFLTDNYWPAIFAEFGFIGTLLFLLVIYRILKRILKNKNSISKFASLFGFLTLLISSFVTSSFLGTGSVLAMMLVAIALNYVQESNDIQR